MDEYNELIAKERDASNSIEDFTNNIQELNNEIKILELAEKVQNATSSIGNANQQMDRLNDKLSLLEVKLKNASGIDKVNLLDEQIKIWQQLSKYQSDTLSQMMSALNVYRNELNNYGFKFDEFGNISNLESALNALKDSADYEYIKDTLDKWKELYNEEIPSAEESILEYKNAIKDANNTKLETTKSVEDKITDMIKDQLEKRKDAIKKQADEEIKLINKKKEEYNALREEMNYKDDYDEQMKKINKLKQQLEIAQRDDSLSSKNKVQELLEQLEEENKKLQEIVQDKIDNDINDMLDKESEKIQEESDKRVEDLEDEWTEEKISNAVENAINSGKFTDLEGNIVDLKSAMIDFAEESGEAFGVLGDKIKQEICDNLVIAQDVMKDLSTIYKELEISTPKLTSSIQGLSNNKSRQVTVGDTYFTISSGVNADMIKNIEKMIDRKNEQLIKDIESKI